MFSIVCLVIGAVFGAACAIAVSRLARNGRIGGAGGQNNYAASQGLGGSLATTQEINDAVDRAIRANTETAEVIQKMRDIIERYSGVTGDGTGDTNTES